MFFSGQLEVELVPQGTIAARLRAAGNGMPAIFTPAGAGTLYANGGIPLKYAPDGSVAVWSEPRPTQMFDGKEYVMEYALRPEVSLVKAWKADTRGNLIFRGTSQNANPDCAVAGKVVLVSVVSAACQQLSGASSQLQLNVLSDERRPKLKRLSKPVSWILMKFTSLVCM